MNGALQISGTADGLLDDDLILRVRGAGPDTPLTWRARYRDDDGRVWRAAAPRAEDLMTRWVPAKDGTGPIAALRSLRPLSIDVRAETDDGRGASRTVTRRLAADGVRSRRWRDGLAATLHLPATPAGGGAAAPSPEGVGAAAPCATVLIDATRGGLAETVATLAAPLLASRGALVLVVWPSAGGDDAAADRLATARERLSALPAAAGEILVLPAIDPFDPNATGGAVVLPPGVGARDPQSAAAARAAAWDELLLRLRARPRERAPG